MLVEYEGLGLTASQADKSLVVMPARSELAVRPVIRLEVTEHPGWGFGVLVHTSMADGLTTDGLPQLANDLNLRGLSGALDQHALGAWVDGPSGLDHVAFVPAYVASGDPEDDGILLTNLVLNELLRLSWLEGVLGADWRVD